jgi:3-dehydroquinate synthase
MADILHVETSAARYPIYMGSGILSDFKQLLPEGLGKAPLYFVCDTATEIYARKIADGRPVFTAPSGEATKSFSKLQEIAEWALSHKIDRKSAIAAVGGGVIGDLAGFAASVILRGIPVVQVPTTLLAMVDSSVGGKTGINMPQGKNLIGAFHQPAAVICDFDVLTTLPEREMKAGYAEILKYALLGDAAFFDWLEENGAKVLALEPEAVAYAVRRSCEMKAEIVKADEKETTGKRALLNLGHTFAHAFEAAMGYDGRLLHGEAVAVGMMCAMELSVAKGLMSGQQVERVAQHMRALDLKSSIADIDLPENATPEALYDKMRGDKKASDGKINFILMTAIGQAFMTHDVEEGEVISVLS